MKLCHDPFSWQPFTLMYSFNFRDDGFNDIEKYIVEEELHLTYALLR